MRKTVFAYKTFLVVYFSLVMVGGYCVAAEKKYIYPKAPVHHTYNNYFGTKVDDPYRWLEKENSHETIAWVKKEKKLTESFLTRIPDRNNIKNRLTELLNYERYSGTQKKGDRYFYFKNDGLQNQSVLYVQEGIAGKSRVIIDPNALSKDGTIALSNLEISKDGKLLAYAISEGGSDQEMLKILNVDTGKEYEEVIRWCKFTSIAWKIGNEGFYYSRYPEPGTVPVEDENFYNMVYWHQLGTAQSKDQLVYKRTDQKEWGFSPVVSDDGKYLILYVSHGTDPKNRIYFREIEKPGSFILLLDKADAHYDFLSNDGPIFYFHTDLNASNGRIVAININDPDITKWKEIIPEQKDVIDYVSMVNNQFVVSYMHNVWNKLMVFNLDGALAKEIKMPEFGSIEGVSGDREHTEMFISYTSMLYPLTIFRYDFKEADLAEYQKPKMNFDFSSYETTQIFYQSKDGTQVPMFITHRKGIALDSNNLAWLYGYGGFNISMKPYFSASRLVWLEHGGVYAIANIRGGNEFGEKWHQAGILEKKQNVFDDFVAAAQYLIQNKYTDSSRLVIEGASNGGLLVAATMLQHPDLFGAVVCHVPVTDMLRYQKFTVGAYWAPEFGNAEKSADQFKVLYAYSPLHNVKKGVKYPPILVLTAEGDDRVVPSHAMKFVATLQTASAGNNLVLMRVESRAGHGHGKPISKIIEEQADIFAFVFEILRVSREGVRE